LIAHKKSPTGSGIFFVVRLGMERAAPVHARVQSAKPSNEMGAVARYQL
jgi:hypothetical protein